LRHSNYEHAKKESIEEIRKILNAPKMKKIPDKQVRALHLSFFAESLGKAVEHAQKCANDVQSFIPSLKGAKEQLLDAMQKVEELKPKVEKLAKLRLTE
jgi:archaellum component FlaC